MNPSYLQVSLQEIDPPRPLCQQIFSRILLARRRAARLRLMLQTGFCFSVGLLLVPLAQYAGEEFFNSGFYEYASLFFSNRNAVVSSWHAITYSLIESLPSIPLLLILLCLLALVWSLRLAVREAHVAFIGIPQLL